MSKKTAEVTVSNSINMNLTQGDIIDLAIQTEIERQEEILEKLVSAKDAVEKKIKTVQREYMSSAKKEIEKDKEYLAFTKMANSIGLPISIDEDSLCFHNYNDTLLSPAFPQGDYSRCHNQAKPLIYFKQYASQNVTYQVRISREVYYTLKASKDGISLSSSKNYSLKGNAQAYNKMKKELTELLESYANLSRQIYNVHLNLLEASYNDKKVKARIVKASLSKSDEGKALLSMLEGARNTKLLLG